MYSNPPTWAHGEQNASAARFNVISDDLNALHAAMLGDHLAVAQMVSGETASFVNTWRWLHYMSITGETATLTDPSGAGADVTLADSDTVMGVYDLGGVAWLTTGQVYTVTGCQYSVEDGNA